MGMSKILRFLLQKATVMWGITVMFFSTIILRGRIQICGGYVGKGFAVRGWIQLHIVPTGSISIGDNVRINSGFGNNAVGGFRRMGIWVGPEGVLSIGNNVGVSSSTIVCMQAVTIEDDVYIGGDCKIYDTDFHSINTAERLSRPDRGVQRAPVRLGRACFIGGHSILLKGSEVGEEAVVGAGSVVTKTIPPGQVWGGNPAKAIVRIRD
jgi:acetyltransferase-like isoleucine patch superfamily enzyme